MPPVNSDRGKTRLSHRPIIVTGVSSGIGRAIAVAAIESGIPVFGSVRTAEDAKAFERELGPSAKALQFDLRDDRAISAAAERVFAVANGAGLAALINNAGPAVPGPLEHLPLKQFREQIDSTLTGTLAVTQAFLPLLRGKKPGRIINVSSVAGSTAMPFLGAYAIAKHGIEAMSDSLRREVRVHGINVTIVQPGGVQTPIWEKAARANMAVAADGYEGPLATFRDLALAAGDKGLPAEKIARLVIRIVGAKRPKYRYLISPNPGTERLMRAMPHWLLDRLIAWRLGITRRR